MSRDLLKKEILEQLLSLRLTLAFILVVSLMVGSSVFFLMDYEAQLSDYDRQVNEETALLSKRLSGEWPMFTAFSWDRLSIYRKPNPLGFLSEGRDKDLPNRFRLNAFKLESSEYSLRGNPLLGEFDLLDWSFVIGVVLSFAAILLAHDAVNGEKQRGTLRLVLSNPVPRARLLLSKYFATMVLLAIPLLLGGLISLLLISLSGVVPLAQQEWVKIVLVIGVSLLYLSVFVLLGLLLSTLLKETQASLVVALLLWVVLVIVIPAGAALGAKALVQMTDYDQVAEQAAQAERAAFEDHNRRYPHPDNWAMSGNWSPGEPLLRAFQVAYAGSAVRQRHEDRQIAQVRLGQDLARLSPAGLYNSAAVLLAGSGIAHYEAFVRQARRYRQELGKFVEGRYPFDPVHPLDGTKVQAFTRNQKIDFQSVPKFDDRPTTIGEGWNAAAWDVGFLALLNVVLFAATWLLFLRYDVR